MAFIDKISAIRMKEYIYIFLGVVGIIKLLEEKNDINMNINVISVRINYLSIIWAYAISRMVLI